ncbi:DHH phosphoesterase [Salix suchowensis]|nr:DHH phosphoesterase [Salix suchowensis]
MVSLVGIFGDLGPSEIKFGDSEGDWPVSEEMLRLGDTIRVPEGRRSLTVALLSADGPTTITNNRELRRLRFRINEEVERCSRAAPRFSKDGCVALLRVDSQYQVHPVVAIRWASRLKGKDLKMIMVVNPSHHPDPNLVSFSCRIPASLRKVAETAQPNLQQLLKGYAAKVDAGFLTRVGAIMRGDINRPPGESSQAPNLSCWSRKEWKSWQSQSEGLTEVRWMDRERLRTSSVRDSIEPGLLSAILTCHLILTNVTKWGSLQQAELERNIYGQPSAPTPDQTVKRSRCLSCSQPGGQQPVEGH